jgi:hypothetical protein
MFPVNAQEWNNYYRSESRRANGDVTNRQVHSGTRRPVNVTRPIQQAGPSHNWNDIPLRGYNMNHLNTYVIPRHDAVQLSLFSRHILGQPGAPSKSKLVDNALKRIQERHPHLGTPPVDIKQEYRNSVRGPTTMNPRSQVNTN